MSEGEAVKPSVIKQVWLCPVHAEEFWVPHGGICPAVGCDRELRVYWALDEVLEVEAVALAIYEARIHATVIHGWRSEPEALKDRFRNAARAALAAADAVQGDPLEAEIANLKAKLRAYRASERAAQSADEVEALRKALQRIANAAELNLGFVAQRQIAQDALRRFSGEGAS